MTATTLLHLIETAARAADCCPHAVYTSRKRTADGNRAIIARNLVLLRLYQDGETIPRIAKAFRLSTETIRKNLRTARCVKKNPTAIAVTRALHLQAA